MIHTFITGLNSLERTEIRKCTQRNMSLAGLPCPLDKLPSPLTLPPLLPGPKYAVVLVLANASNTLEKRHRTWS